MIKKLLATTVIAAISSQAGAFEFSNTPDDFDIRWDNSFKFNVISRVAKQDKDVYTAAGEQNGGAGATNGWWLADDSDLSVDRSGLGLVSTRFDVVSELDIIWKRDFGFRISGAAWYDPQYKDSDHPGDRRYTWASPTVEPGEYSEEAKDLHYAGGELLDAFVFANFDIGDTALGIRAGRHTIYWGNSLLATGAIAGIGGAMAPLDFAKALSVPGSEAKELFMPANKISTVFQVTDNLTLNAYYGLEHRRYRLPATGTYFSPAEGLSEDTQFITVPAGDPNSSTRTGFKTLGDKKEDKEWGFNVQYYVDAWELETSFIYLNYVDKNLHGLHAGFDLGQLGLVLAGSDNELAGQAAALLGIWQAGCGADDYACPISPEIDGNAGTVTYGSGRWLFKDDIDLFGLSFAKEIGGVSVGTDIVLRQNTGLAPDLGNGLQRIYNLPSSPPFPLDGDALVAALPVNSFIPEAFDSYSSDNYLGAVGDVWSVVINGVGLLSDNGFWEGGSWILEATFQMLDDCTKNCELLDTRVEEDRVVSTIGAVFQPTWFQVRPGWDLTLPMAVSYTLDGKKSPFTFGGDHKRGSGSIGAELLIDQSWTVNMRYNLFFGPVRAGIGGLLKDRDNISLTFKRTI